MEAWKRLFEEMPPDLALTRLSVVARNLLTHLDEQARVDFVRQLLGTAGSDKVASLVDL